MTSWTKRCNISQMTQGWIHHRCMGWHGWLKWLWQHKSLRMDARNTDLPSTRHPSAPAWTSSPSWPSSAPPISVMYFATQMGSFLGFSRNCYKSIDLIFLGPSVHLTQVLIGNTILKMTMKLRFWYLFCPSSSISPVGQWWWGCEFRISDNWAL